MRRRIEFSEANLRKWYTEEKLSLRDIAKRYSCDSGVVARALRNFGIPVRKPKKILPLNPEKLRTLYVDKALSTYAIADILKCDPKTVYTHLKRNGITPRSKEHIKLSSEQLTNLYEKERMSLHDIAAEYGYSAAGILKKFKEFGIQRRSISETSTKHQKHDFNGSEEDKAYVIGFRIGDLGVRQRQNLIYISSGTTKNAQVKLITSLFSPYGPVWIGKPNTKGALNVSASINKSFSFLLPKHESIPAWIQDSDSSFFAFLAGYTDAEGNFAVGNGSGRFRLRSYDLGILNGLHRGLTKRGIPATYRLDKSAGIDYRGVKQNKDSWGLTVARKDSLNRLLTVLLPLLRHEKRKSDAVKVMENVARRLA